MRTEQLRLRQLAPDRTLTTPLIFHVLVRRLRLRVPRLWPGARTSFNPALTRCTTVQIRSHAQKYFIQMEKKGRKDMIPPTNNERKHLRVQAAAAKHTVAQPSTVRFSSIGFLFFSSARGYPTCFPFRV